MAQLYIPDINDELAQAYLNASKEQQQRVKQIVEEAITRWMQTPNSPPTPKRRLLQKGSQMPFNPFKAVKMNGKGPSASEMVIQDRE
ncbi:MAG: hypothetical protein DRR08_01005 [Candidatus Parabeggiatoa sp. nov. 2]|nr:MAG: hypothetical protein B6247_02980 [Beggiatoa sp. 4572_84]RKZ64294.1 MAG: hypothetical protein DRR08_01005 [Gammaproteobacteria bacterium]